MINPPKTIEPGTETVGFRIADLAAGFPQHVFRFLNKQTVAVTSESHSGLVEAASDYARGNQAAFEEQGISFAGITPDHKALDAFARQLVDRDESSGPGPGIGRFWTGFRIPDVGIFDGVSFWLGHADLRERAWLESTAIELLGLKNPKYVETTDQCVPELTRTPVSRGAWKSRIAPHLTPAEIRKILRRAGTSNAALSRSEWEIVAEFKGQAYDVIRPTEASWRWNRQFFAHVDSRRSHAAFSALGPHIGE